MDYQEDNNYDYDNSSSQAGGSAAKGLKIAIIILLLVLAAVSFLYWKSVQQDAADLRAMQADRDTIANQYGRLIVEMDDLQFENDTLNAD